MSDRRKFIRGFGLIGAAFAGAASAKVVIEEKKPEVEDISHLAPPDRACTLQISGSYPEKPIEPPQHKNGMIFMPSNGYYPPTHSVSMTVGKDNRLWIKVGEDWRRVAIE